jgi:uncharacterized protein YunC (DUF1805 family)
MEPVVVEGRVAATAVTVHLPRTTLVVAAAAHGYVMCGALDVRLLDERLGERRIVAARVVGARSVADLLALPVDDVTAAAAERGVVRGMTGREALVRMGA